MINVPPSIIDPDRLRLARLRRRLLQRHIALQLGVAPQRVSDFEQGLRHPAPEQVSLLARALGSEIFVSKPEANS